MSRLERTKTFIKNPWLKAPCTVFMTGFMLTFSTPLACALFPQKAEIKLSALEAGAQARVRREFPGVETFYFNKGL
jgi:hypothetical protein